MNAIILAAGMGKRLLPATLNRPKPLLIVNSQPIIERQIILLKEAGINDIHIVVGYLGDSFKYLINKFNVNLIYNPKYNDINNIYSLYLAKEFLLDSLIIEGDIFLTRNIFNTKFGRSFYFIGLKFRFMEESILNFNANNRLTNIIKPKELISVDAYKKKGAYISAGISFWNKKNSAIMQDYLEKGVSYIFKYPNSTSKAFYWDDIVKANLNTLEVYVKEIDRNDWFEIDSVKDLNYLNNFLKKNPIK
jgi:CTP:phosphocholine cytidylyltransferase-like protein